MTTEVSMTVLTQLINVVGGVEVSSDGSVIQEESLPVIKAKYGFELVEWLIEIQRQPEAIQCRKEIEIKIAVRQRAARLRLNNKH